MKQYQYYDGFKVYLLRLSDNDNSYRICGTDGKLVEMGDEMWLMSAWAKNILKKCVQ